MKNVELEKKVLAVADKTNAFLDSVNDVLDPDVRKAFIDITHLTVELLQYIEELEKNV